MCEQALRSLDLIPDNLEVNDTKKPAGCYWKSNGDGFFNNIIDPSMTDTIRFSDRGVIGSLCTLAGKNCERMS